MKKDGAYYERLKTHPFLSKWLRGLTCRTDSVLEVYFENADYIVLKHGSHPSYLNRFDGSVNCESYARLFRKTDLLAHDSHLLYNGSVAYNRSDTSADIDKVYGFMKEWKGRIARSRVKSECLDMGIKFE